MWNIYSFGNFDYLKFHKIGFLHFQNGQKNNFDNFWSFSNETPCSFSKVLYPKHELIKILQTSKYQNTLRWLKTAAEANSRNFLSLLFFQFFLSNKNQKNVKRICNWTSNYFVILEKYFSSYLKGGSEQKFLKKLE